MATPTVVQSKSKVQGEAQGYLDQALRKAARWASIEVVEELIQRGCRPVPKIMLELVARPEPLKVMKHLEEKHGLNVSASVVDQSGLCALSLAARKGDLDVCRYLVQKGANVNQADRSLQTPLFWAASKHHAEICQFLLSAGADNNHIDKWGYRPFFWAAHKGNLKGMEVLLQDTPIDMQTTSGWTPLFRATASSAKWLIDRGAQVNHVDNVRKQSAIFFAVSRNDQELVKVLLRHGADINLKDQYGQTCLFYAVTNGLLEMAKLLVEMKADIYIKDDGGRTATFFARNSGPAKAENTIRYVESLMVRDRPQDPHKKRRGRPAQVSSLAKAAAPHASAGGRRSNPPLPKPRRNVLRNPLAPPQRSNPPRSNPPRAATSTSTRKQQPPKQTAAVSTGASRKRKEARDDDKGPRKKYRYVQAETYAKLTSKQKKMLLQHCPYLAR